MLAADKLQLQSALKQQATALKEKEFNLHHSNLMTVGTQAAVLAGLDITMFIEFQPPPNEAWGAESHLILLARTVKFLYYITIVAAFCANMMVVSHTTALSVLGAGMALRGPDGSMMTATDGLYEERKSVFYVFGVGLACTVGSVVLCVWLILHWEAALVCMTVTMYTCCKIYRNYQRVMKRFDFDESETVDFRDIFEGPAAIRVMPYVANQATAAAAMYRHQHSFPAADASKRPDIEMEMLLSPNADESRWLADPTMANRRPLRRTSAATGAGMNGEAGNSTGRHSSSSPLMTI